MAAFGLRYFAQLRSKYKSVFWCMEIAEHDYSGSSEEMEFSGDGRRRQRRADSKKAEKDITAR